MQPKPTYIPIKNWSSDDKPREKLLLKSKDVLSDAELIAILIGSGSRNESAVTLAKRILALVQNDLNDLGKLSVKQLMQFKGIGEAKAVTIAAALEIGRRRREEDAKKIVAIKESRDVFELLHPKIGDLSHEEFWVVYLNNANTVLFMGQLSKGGITGTLVDVRLVLKQALELGAVGLILAHNHPSGTLKPSVADKQITVKLKTASQVLDIKVLDHLIITQKEYFSFADEHIL
ncbi:DNA repair protein RadC [Arenibacter nanhaiticus]|uniref:DNA repair protein RadC n=1 Tax=Arenibacter nanhaiticus TaxID=558155 RepID=A0A1M6EU43_9FLAO|nr:DNA repair protein RadC [Arenibacter nanhaiticus]SHI88947.1 DNA repair protein RadC [Arenibacter nanhaiticus]